MARRFKFWSVAILTMLLLIACTRTVQIKTIIDNPREYADKKVAIEGEVTGAFSLFIVKYFLVNDGTGEIGVVSEKALPNKGQKIRVIGTIKEAFSLGDQTMTILIEEKPEQNKDNAQ
ncbi:hypothetical protein [Sulfurirhabdus autotrophica]|uniref:OB-fold nucleic acid binding protein n=1 Tax=Sulfurirhabdus autotrophica TaxID=1706046 RepID=A0A4R3Y119_9PROT|nr:hypothetical protein [Sulfurirhabdus autotrophica]TCV85340.1 hypothetical protein EDC63_10911 [Sulfurirhabdus autotrophica]